MAAPDPKALQGETHDTDHELAPRVLSPDEVKARSRRNWAIALALAAFVILVFVVTLARLGANVLDRPI